MARKTLPPSFTAQQPELASPSAIDASELTFSQAKWALVFLVLGGAPLENAAAVLGLCPRDLALISIPWK
jgi:hypothetical protein